MRKRAALVTGVGSVAILLGCLASTCPAPPSQLPTDVATEATCVMGELVSGVTDIPTIAKVCTQNEQGIAADLVEWLISSLTLQAKIGGANLGSAAANVKSYRLTLAHP